jgi:hypothetical protein
MTSEPTIRSQLREIIEGPVRDLPTPEATLKAEAKARTDREKAAKGRAGQLARPLLFGRKAQHQITREQEHGENAMRDRRVWWIVAAVVVVIIVAWVVWPASEVPTPAAPATTTQ